MNLELGELGGAIRARARSTGWSLELVDGIDGDLTSLQSWPRAALSGPGGRRAARETAQLLEIGYAVGSPRAVSVSWEAFGEAVAEGFDILVRWTEASPFLIAIDRRSDLGRPDFEYRYRFRLSAANIHVERCGYFLHRPASRSTYHIEPHAFALVEAMDTFNAQPPDSRKGPAAWMAFGLVRRFAAEIGAELEGHLAANTVVVPAEVGIALERRSTDGAVALIPTFKELDEARVRSAYFAAGDRLDVLSMDAPNGARVRIALGGSVLQAVQRMRTIGWVSAKDQQQVLLATPEDLFDGLLDVLSLPPLDVPATPDEAAADRSPGDSQLPPAEAGSSAHPATPAPAVMPEATVPSDAQASADFGERVIGHGNTRPGGIPKPQGSGLLDLGTEDPQPAEAADPTGITPPAGAEHDASVPGSLKIDATTISAYISAVRTAIAEGSPTAKCGGIDLSASTETLAQLENALETRDKRAPVRVGNFLLIYTDETDLRANDELAVAKTVLPEATAPPTALPLSLSSTSVLKPTQLEGLHWLETCAQTPARSGALLADEMGLGKTLQVLSFAAWLIERSETPADGTRPLGITPLRPVLIVMPLMLLENETWQSDMRRFFVHDGNVFEPLLVLHGKGIEQVRRKNAGRTTDTSVGSPQLDATQITSYRCVLTNYDTVVRYQHSLAQRVNGKSLWSAVVLDEAQKAKSPSARVSQALKAIAKGTFCIASTGTPVENRLLDLWNIVDTFQPALLGTAREFSKRYERPLAAGHDKQSLDELRRRLHFGQPASFLKRKTKADLDSLPPKVEHREYCDMTPAEVLQHRRLVSTMRGPEGGRRALQVLHGLSHLYQHPFLLGGSAAYSETEALARSSKLRKTLELLRAIRARGEKAIIFARLIAMQQMLADTIAHEFGIPVNIINGETKASGLSERDVAPGQRMRSTRKAILDAFKREPGFGVLVLSPFVAGIGLTVTEANNVIHYGRWWNPAVEAQATDRVHRIGQTKEVHVYIPILRDPQGQLRRSFDECVDDLLNRKRDLADDFLRPMDEEDRVGEELRDALLQDEGTVVAEAAGEATAALTPAEAKALDPFAFEALVAAMLAAEGHGVVLTARTGDGGADVVAVRGRDVLIVQVKQVTGGGEVGPQAINDLVQANDLYWNRLKVPIRLALVTNGPIARDARRLAGEHAIDLTDAARFHARLRSASVSRADLAIREADRCRGFDAGLDAIKRLLG